MNKKRKQCRNEASIHVGRCKNSVPSPNSQTGSAVWTIPVFGALGALLVFAFQNSWFDVQFPFASPPQTVSVSRTDGLSPSLAEETSVEPAKDTEIETDWRSSCRSVGSLAETIMRRRQDGTSMAVLIDRVAETGSDVAYDELIIEAYDRPRYSTSENQRESIERFRDDMYLECVQAF